MKNGWMKKWVHNDDGWMDEEVRGSEIMKDGWMKKWVHNEDGWMDEEVHGRRLGTLC
jgi:hypothetical protein